MKRHDKKSLVISIGKLWSGGEGTTEKMDIKAEIIFDTKEITTISEFTASAMLIKLKKEISVILNDAIISVERTCEKCLAKYEYEVSIPSAERQFLVEKPQKETDIHDTHLINMHDMTIDLYEMVRQEIILHFPLISVCSKSCKGLCSKCGKNRNKYKCECKEDKPEENKPFKDLKTILS